MSSLIGAAGEYYVMSELLRRGMIAALAPLGVPNCDILITDRGGRKFCAIQVKTRGSDSRDKGWHMNKEHEKITGSMFFYCFVDFVHNGSLLPIAYIIPARVVAKNLTECYRAWLGQPGKNGRQRNDNNFRRFLPDNSHLGIEKYNAGWLEEHKNAWHVLQQTVNV
ncbi:MAG: hypothetical protein RIB41_09585 [Oceanibaculum nanhaiense]|jgi:hypothetical protein|uniref:hypothetical protein n=1 Tax=Oceanibaculum nanhaiense TaxID=1909734 RepID=UPI0032ED87F5